MSDAIEAERKRAIAAIHWVFSADGTVGERAMAQEAIHKINDPIFMPPLAAPVEPAADFDGWWSSDGQYLDPDTSEVPWFDKRRGLAEYAYAAGKTSAITAYEAAKGGGAGVKPGATAWENIHNGAIRRVEPNDPENYIALGPITSPANGERDAPSGYVLVPVEPTEDTAELIARLREACNGHPHAKIAWPHRVLHEAADALSSLVRERDEALEAAYDQPHGPTSRILWSTRYSELLDDYKDTEQVARLTRERDDALATISLLQSQHRKQQEHDTAIIERLTRDVMRETKALHAIMLVAEGGCAVVKIEIGGQWIELIRESLDGPFSHIIEPSGIDRRASEASLLSNTSEVGKDE